jgi:hypothetical protein
MAGNVERVRNPNDLDLVERSYRTFLNGNDRPALIPGWQEFAFCAASIASMRMVLIASCSTLFYWELLSRHRPRIWRGL